jgi:FMN phosphatase YigB (HAD superfamily)
LAVLFDLDDTLFDLRHSSRIALTKVQARYSALRDISLDQLEWDYRQLLDEMHAQVVRGVYSLQRARLLRWRRFFAAYGVEISDDDALATSRLYHEIYDGTQRAVPGAIELLQTLKPRVKIGIVTNNARPSQQAKLDHCGLAPYCKIKGHFREWIGVVHECSQR